MRVLQASSIFTRQSRCSQSRSTNSTSDCYSMHNKALHSAALPASLIASWGKGISVLVASLLMLNHPVIQANQRTNDATCWPNPWSEWAGSRSSRTHQIRSRGSSDLLAVDPALRILQLNVEGLSAAKRSIIRDIAERHNVGIYSTKRMMTRSYGWNLQRLQHSRNNKWLRRGELPYHLQHIFYFLFDVQTALQQTLIATVRNYIWGGVENKETCTLCK